MRFDSDFYSDIWAKKWRVEPLFMLRQQTKTPKTWQHNWVPVEEQYFPTCRIYGSPSSDPTCDLWHLFIGSRHIQLERLELVTLELRANCDRAGNISQVPAIGRLLSAIRICLLWEGIVKLVSCCSSSVVPLYISKTREAMRTTWEHAMTLVMRGDCNEQTGVLLRLSRALPGLFI